MRTYINDVYDFRENEYCKNAETVLTDGSNVTKSSFQKEDLKIERLINNTLINDQRFFPFQRTLGLHKQSI